MVDILTCGLREAFGPGVHEKEYPYRSPLFPHFPYRGREEFQNPTTKSIPLKCEAESQDPPPARWMRLKFQEENVSFMVAIEQEGKKTFHVC